MSDEIKKQERHTEAARLQADLKAYEAQMAWNNWSYARSREQEAFEAYLVEYRKLNQMKGEQE